MTNASLPGERVFSAVLRSDYLSFVAKAFAHIEGGNLRYAKHLDLLCAVVWAMVEGRLNRVLINQPPRTLKSFVVTVCHIAWRLGHDPALRVIIVCHDSRLAESMADKVRRIIQSDWYKDAFPSTELREDFNKREHFHTTQGGEVYTASLSAGLTGHGADLIIVDDPIDAGKVGSEIELQQVNDLYESKLKTRLNNAGSGQILVVMQRLHNRDLSGHLLGVGGYEAFVLPLVAEVEQSFEVGGFGWTRPEGDVLDPAQNTSVVLADLKRNPAIFRTQYQQDPRASTETIIPRGLIRRYDQVPTEAFHTLMSLDAALSPGGSGSYSVCLTFKTDGTTYYLCDVWRARVGYSELEQKVLELVSRFNPELVVVEKANVGDAVAHVVEKKVSRKTKVVLHKPVGSKEDRLIKVLDIINDGRIVVPQISTFSEMFLEEIHAFPQGAFDDQVDALSQLLRVVREIDDSLFVQLHIARPPPPPFGKRHAMRDPKAPPRNFMPRPRPRPRR